MIIKSYSKLNKKTINEVLNLEKICQEHDMLKGSVFLDTSLNFDQSIKSTFLLYENRELISILSMFIPTQEEAEISAFTLPEYRRNGYFKALLEKAVEELRKFDIQNILFVCEKQSISGKGVLTTLNAEYDHTEYSMRFNKTRYEYKDMFRLSLIPTHFKDLNQLIDISMKIFNDGYEDSKSIIENCLQSETRELYLAVLNDEIVGMSSINQERDEALIFGLGIVPEYRGKGYGKELLHLIIDRLWQTGKTELMLDVNSDNAHALELYKKSGFQIEVAFEYYRKKVSEIYK
ncbi:GNAT family N-acetyltransferase [Desulfosporosinus sp. BG]|uniref:GNAT family N-acetyltransferase n=1 Tax=Desulfosporosinus sp. BG TaxID=1633135 RepID=UPI00083B2FD2|nr:GNAT family N-acetyltransferase [Desulfosporosinus sp. BG]ODA39879.1 Acetyltransferase, GNAT family [Desulfosporosinus sp. BG]